MAPSHTVNLIEATRVAPSPNPVPRHGSLPLTALDHMFLGFQPVERLFFYEPSQPRADFPNLVHRLKTSLSHALRHFYPLAGKLELSPETDKPEIRYQDDDSIAFLVVKTDADFDHLSGNQPRNGSDFCGLVPPLLVSDPSSPLVSVQVTGFPNGGFSVGISVHHVAADGRCSVQFLKSWAELCRTNSENLSQTQLPFYDRSLLLARTDLMKVFEGGPSKYFAGKTSSTSDRPIETQFLRTTLSLGRIEIQKLKQLASKRLTQTQNPVSFSTFVVACAHTWVCLVNSRKIGEEQKRVAFFFGADCRARLNPPLPTAYFGNCVGGGLAEANLNEMLGQNGFYVAVEAIDGAVKTLNEGALTDAESFVARASSVLSGRPVSVAGSPRFGVYEADFGWGKPRKVEVVSIDRSGTISLAESGDGGVEIGVSLPENEMDQFVPLFVDGLKFSV